MTHMRERRQAELEAVNKLPAEAQSEAVAPYLAKTQILAELIGQSYVDKIVPVTAAQCNFEIYEQDKCKGRASRRVRKVETLAETLSFTAPDGRGRKMRVFFSNRELSDVTLEGPTETSQWTRSPKGIERFSFFDSKQDVQWTENPDCSGQMTRRRGDESLEIKWSSPKAEAFKVDYKQCIKKRCHEGTL